MMKWLVIVIVVILLAVGGYYLYTQKYSPNSMQKDYQVMTGDDEASLDQQLNSLEVEDNDSEMTALEKDLQQL